MKLLTISIAAYNAENYIKKALDSLCCKNLSKLEIFVIDDGGSDGTLAIAKEYEKKYPDSIHAVHKENGGLGSTYNYSIENGTGKYIKLLDADDFFNITELEKFVDILQNVDVDAIYSPYLTFDDKTGDILDHVDISSSCEMIKPMSISNLLSYKELRMHSLTFNLQMLKSNKVHILEKCFYTDTEYVTKGLFFSKTIVFTNCEVYNYRLGREGQSVDTLGLKKHYRESIKVAEELLRFYVSNINDGNSKVVLYNLNLLLRFVYNTLLKLGLKDDFISFDKTVIRYKISDKLTIDRRVKLLRYSQYLLFPIVHFKVKNG